MIEANPSIHEKASIVGDRGQQTGSDRVFWIRGVFLKGRIEVLGGIAIDIPAAHFRCRYGGPFEPQKILGRTRDWLRYDVPDQWIKRDWRGNYRGQKQIWFLLRLVGRDCDVCLRANEKPEFDAWRWSDYWVPMEAVIDFKREVYTLALNELASVLFRRQNETRFLRQGTGSRPPLPDPRQPMAAGPLTESE